MWLFSLFALPDNGGLLFPSRMADKNEHHIPTWHGQAKTWRRYAREVAWYVRGTVQEKRKYCATKLISRLTGPARLLAMSWKTAEFDTPASTQLLLQNLSTSPLVRQALP